MRLDSRAVITRAVAGIELAIFQQIQDLLARFEGQEEKTPGERSAMPRGQVVETLTPSDDLDATLPRRAGQRQA